MPRWRTRGGGKSLPPGQKCLITEEAIPKGLQYSTILSVALIIDPEKTFASVCCDIHIDPTLLARLCCMYHQEPAFATQINTDI